MTLKAVDENYSLGLEEDLKLLMLKYGVTYYDLFIVFETGTILTMDNLDSSPLLKELI